MNYISNNQLKLVKSFDNQFTRIVFVTGPAGSGKTRWACKTALKNMKKKNLKRVIITRPTITVDEDLGYLPGDINEKIKPWLIPMTDYLHIYETIPLGFMRGRTFDDSFIVADEMQNSTNDQLKMLLTRIGQNSYMIITGDTKQSDINENGLENFLELYEKHCMINQHCLLTIQYINFTRDDVMRDEVVKDILDIYND